MALSPNAYTDASPYEYLGFYAGSFPLWFADPNNINQYISTTQGLISGTNPALKDSSIFDYQVQYEYPTGSGNWITYDEKYWPVNFNRDNVARIDVADRYFNGDGTSACDPRTARFSALQYGSQYQSTRAYLGAPYAYLSGAATNALFGWILNGSASNIIFTDRPDEGLGFIYQTTNSYTTGGGYAGFIGPGFYGYLPSGGANALGPNYMGATRPGTYCQNNPEIPALSQTYRWTTTTSSVTDTQGGITSTPCFFADADGVVRRGMSAYVPYTAAEPAQTAPAGSPFALPYKPAMTYTSNTTAAIGSPNADMASRPVMLNRPFRSVSELGYVFTGTPWRNLDAFTPESGSSALLDVFCVNDTNDPGGLMAGKVDLNTRQASVLQAVLAGAYKDEFAMVSPSVPNGLPYSTANATSVLQPTLSATSATADKISAALVGWTTDSNDLAKGTGPLRNLNELAGRYLSASTLSGTTPATPVAYDGAKTYGGFSGSPTPQSGTAPSAPMPNLSTILYGDTSSTGYYSHMNIERFREATIRALTNCGTTRVWNLMIDVITQTGRFPSTATGLANFNVEGERRYWVHVAIDRYTGKVLDEQIEEVKE
jgi:hypothetical protein